MNSSLKKNSRKSIRFVGQLLLLFLFLTDHTLSGQIPDNLAETILSSELKTVKPGESGWLLIEVEVEPNWHMYWKNAGQSGYPTTVDWNTEGAEFGALEFPTPKAYEFLEMVIYVHEGKFTLLTKMTVDEDFEEDSVRVRGRLSTLICNEENCIPFDADLSIDIPVGQKTQKIASKTSIVKEAKKSWPINIPTEAKLSATVQGDTVSLELSHPSLSDLGSASFYFFPENEFFGHLLKQEFSLDSENGTLNLSLPINSDINPPDQLIGVLTHPGLPKAWQAIWSMESVNYGSEAVSNEKGPVKYQAVQDDMGIAVLMLFLGMVVIAFAVWLYGKGAAPGEPKHIRIRYQVSALVVVIFGVWLAYPAKEVPSEEKIQWGIWSPELEAKLKEEGRAVYVDYTARWCASCIANKRVYEFDSIIELFKEKEIVALRADWTDRGPVILESLQSYNRFGVPLNVFHPSQSGDTPQPVILPEILTQKNVTEAVEDGRVTAGEGELSFLAIVGFAALGGLILNLMPCVFPVIGLKIMSFVKQAGEDPTQIKKHGLVFTLGVVLSFWLLVGVLLGLRESLSEDLGWGFQLQEPVFVFVLAVFLLIFAMSLSGVFEIGMSITGVGAKLTQSGGLSSSFFSGVLATVVATPCMAPFLGVAVGAALTMEWLPAFTVFTSVALGLSSPYLLLSIFPKWMSKLPKPGAWMDTFKQAMAFPLYGTVVWLLWTLQSLL